MHSIYLIQNINSVLNIVMLNFVKEREGIVKMKK